MMSPQLVEIRLQLVESRTGIADTRGNVVVNSSELGFNIVLYRSNSYATLSNSSELEFNMISCYTVATRAMSPCLGRRR